ncbi:MAG: hypothetical protein IJ743_01065 [Bacilli bacterium]|nr:hypothetical protein [Bacilli bacterium]
MEIKPRNVRIELQNSIDEIEQRIQEYQEIVKKYELYRIIVEMFEPTDIDERIHAALCVPAIYKHLTDEKIANDKSVEILELLYYIKNVEEKNMQDLYDIDKAKKRIDAKINVFIKKKEEYQKIVDEKKNDIRNQIALKKRYIFIKSKLDHQGLLSEKDISLLGEYMNEKGFKVEQKILALEYIRIHNQKIASPDAKIIMQVRDMLHSHYHDLPINYQENLTSLKYQSTIFAYQKALEKSSDIKGSLAILSESQKDFQNLEDYLAILKSLVNLYGQKLNEDIQDLKDNYEDITLRQVILETYNDHQRRYIPLKNLYYEKLRLTQTQDAVKKIVNELYYPGTGDSYMEKDLKEIPNEKLLEVKDLLERKKYQELKPDEDSSLHNNDKLTGLKELRGDQVRICYRHLGENRYAIVGVFLKKSDNLLHEYESMAARKVKIDLSSKEAIAQEWIKSQENEGKIYKYIENNYRIGSR